MNINSLSAIVFIMLMSSPTTIHAHDSHTHAAPWQACEEKNKSSQCSYTNGENDLFKGTCQLFSDTLMCVRNQPIIRAKKPTKSIQKNINRDVKKLSDSPEIQ